MNRWQPIKTAPKDGRLILGYDEKLTDTGKHAKYYYGAYKDDQGHYYRGSQFEVVCWIKAERIQMVQRPDGLFEQKVVDTSHWARSQGSWSPTHWKPIPARP